MVQAATSPHIFEFPVLRICGRLTVFSGCLASGRGLDPPEKNPVSIVVVAGAGNGGAASVGANGDGTLYAGALGNPPGVAGGKRDSGAASTGLADGTEGLAGCVIGAVKIESETFTTGASAFVAGAGATKTF